MRSSRSPISLFGSPQLLGPFQKLFGVGLMSVLGMFGMVAYNGQDTSRIFQTNLPSVTTQQTGYSPTPQPGYSQVPQPYSGPSHGGDVEVYFSPNGGCTEAIVREISQARSIILVQAYSFTSAPIAKALYEAHQHGVQVHVIADKSQLSEKYTYIDFVAHAGIETSIDEEHAIAHNKIMLIDGETIITGSFNFTKNAELSNAENLLIVRGRRDLYAQYEENFRAHHQHSHPYAGRGMGQGPVAQGSGWRY